MLKDKTAIITGGSRGIGAAVAKKFASKGVNIAIVDVGNAELGEQVCAECKAEYGVEARFYACNVTDFEAAKATVGQIKKDFGTAHILINNAGITRDGLIAMMKEKDFDDVINVNLKGAFNMIRHCTNLFIRNRFGRIVNVSSVSGLMGNAGQINYSASKAGIIGITKSVARELASRGVTCNAVAPGFIATSMTKELSEKENELMKSIPLGRVGQVEDVANAIVFLAEADYITGEVLRVDGGMAM
ncbi:MAG: 3-oxoacyl-[acyl-carrier-protein] reductase [Lachnospiraceae bacterium]|jgi:3-oxoacyl-[acyl-carrier protein] reductase